MVEIQVYFSVNATEQERETLTIPKYAMDEFLAVGFTENVYDATVSFRCEPRAINPNLMQIIVNLKELGETIVAWDTIIGSISKFCNKCKGYEPDLVVRYTKENEEVEVSVKFAPDEDRQETIKQIRKLLKDIM